MKNIFKLSLSIAILLCLFITKIEAQKKTQSNPSFKFIENKGQWDSTVKFAADIPGGKIYLKNTGVTYALIDAKGISAARHHRSETSKNTQTKNSDLNIIHTTHVDFIGATSSPTVISHGESETVYNFYLGSDETKWADHCSAYDVVTYKDIYPGVDLKFYSNQNYLKYDFILKKGVNPSVIKFEYSGVQDFKLAEKKLIAKTKYHTIVENIPYAYQTDKHGKTKKLACNYIVENNKVRFSFPKGYKKNQKLTIDPELIFSTFSGSTADNFGYTACFDNAGNLYSGGIVFGIGLPSTTGEAFSGGLTDIGILKYDSTGTKLLYATYIGGNSEDNPHSLVVNNKNELIIMGSTGSPNYPTSANAYDRTFNGGSLFNVFGASPRGDYLNGSDIIITKLDNTGRLKSSTFVGGSGNDAVLKIAADGTYVNKLIRNYGDYFRGDVIFDDDNNIYVASSTDATDFPVTSNIQNTYGGGNSDAVVFSLNEDLSMLRWSTYLGGTDDDAAYSVKLDSENNVYVGGGTASSTFPTTVNTIHPTYNGGIDGFITSIDQVADTIRHSTFLGTTEYDQAYFIDLDIDENVYAFGQTKGDYLITAGTYNIPNSGQFIHKLTNSLDATIFSTVFGSGTKEPNISPTAFLTNECDNIFLSGWGGSTNNRNSINQGNTEGMPVTNDALIKNTDGSDFYLMALSSDGKKLLYATYFGATNNGGDHVDGGTSRFDKRGIIYQSVCSCGGSADNFPTTEGAWSEINRGVNIVGTERCNNASFKFDLATLVARLETDNPEETERGLKEGCTPLAILFLNKSINGTEYFWDFGDGNTSTEKDRIVNTYDEPGSYKVTLRVRDINTCQIEDVATTTITVHESIITVGDDKEICGGDEVRINASGGISYDWTKSNGDLVSHVANPIVAPDTTTTYYVTVTDVNGCFMEDSVKVDVFPQVIADFEVKKTHNCQSLPIFSFTSTAQNADAVLWNFGDGTTSNELNPTHQFPDSLDYTVSLLAMSSGKCLNKKSIVVSNKIIFVPNVVTLNNDGKNEKFIINTQTPLEVTIVNRWGKKLYKSKKYNNDWPKKDVPSGIYYYDLIFPDGSGCNGWIQVLR